VATPFEYFKSWYSDVIRGLYDNRSAGFVILLSVFPLLERYTRQKLRLPAHADLHHHQAPFYDELVNLLPELKTRDQAREFWGVYRNGLLHMVTLSSETRKRIKLPGASLSHDFSASVSIDGNGYLRVNPKLFAERVLQIIENDFPTFENSILTFPHETQVTVASPYDYYREAHQVTGTALPQTFVKP
jgi:hypothetical protein